MLQVTFNENIMNQKSTLLYLITDILTITK